MFLSNQIQKFRKNQKFYILGSLFFVALLIWIAVFAKAENGLLEVNFFDAGQGDAIFIEVPGGTQILIDGGPDDKVIEKLGKAIPFWDRTIDMIILSHPEKDHISGLLEVLKRYKVDYILWTGVIRNTPEYQEWQKLLGQERAVVEIARAGQRIILSRNVLNGEGGIYLDILYPFENLEGREIKDSNNTSIVSRLVFGANSFLFTGDIEKSAEYELLGFYTGVKPLYISDVLKVAHHGSKTSTTEAFVKAVNPKIAVIQAGRNNRYGHPTEQVLQTLKNFGIKILRTDLDKDIKILSDKTSLIIRN